MIKFLFLCCLSLCQSVLASSDLEEYAQDFVLEVKKISISEAPYAFNPSIVKWEGKTLLSFREILEPSCCSSVSSSSDSRIGLIWLDENFEPLGSPQILHLTTSKMASMQSEDARLIVIGQHLYLVYSGNGKNVIDDEGFRMYVAELEFDGEFFHVLSNECLSEFEGKNKNKREKNWVPFSYDDELYLAYSLKPHKILKPYLDGSQKCETICMTMPSTVWEWGELRGGTPALPIDDNHYLAFFHSSKYMASQHSHYADMYHYFMGAYLFSKQPPFEIKQISPEPITGKGFYHGERYDPYWHPVQVVFPCGFMFDENYIWISFGRQDHEILLAKLDKKSFLKFFINVSTIKN